MQSRLMSFVEAWTNIFVGIGINFTANLLILPWFGFPISLAQNAQITALFTAISLARTYGLRRLFNLVRH